MLSFRAFLTEFNLSKISRTLDKGHPIGTVSPEREGMKGKDKKAAHKAIQAHLRRESDKGMISFTGPHKGRYRYKDTGQVSQEGSYVLRPGNHPKAKDNFHRILTRAGKKFNQQSVLKANSRGGSLRYSDGTSEKIGSKVHYNRPLEGGSGDTQLKGKKASFTVK